jgi:PAS domain S-box-containing protein
VKSQDITRTNRKQNPVSSDFTVSSQKMQEETLGLDKLDVNSSQWQELHNELVDNCEKYQYLLDHTPTGIYEVDGGNHFRSVNTAMCKALGYSESELLSMTPSSLLYPESKKRHQQWLLESLSGKEVEESIECHIKTKNGAGLWAVMHVLFIRKGTEVDGALVIVHDVTERKRSERELLSAERKYRRLFETTHDGIMARDLKGNMITCNPAYAKMLGYTRKELRGISVKQLIPEKWHAQRDKIAQKVIETGRSILFEREYRRKDGSVFPASVRTWRLTDGKGKAVGIWSIVREISLQKQQQRSLEEHAGILEQIVQDREKKLKDSERLVAIGQTAGMVGHDLRNPLQALTGELYLAKGDVATLPEGEAKSNLAESIRVMEDQILYMDKIVSDLQAFVQPVRIDKKPVNLAELLSGVLQTVTVPPNVAVRLENTGGALQVRVDPQLLKRVLINLVTNAVQAMPNGGELLLTAQVDSGGHVSISVADTGMGIPDAIRSQIFTPLFTTKPRGQGFGLAVCKRVIEAHGGTISFESAEGKGSRFTVAFPSV